MRKAIKYTIFHTKWGYFGLAGTKYALCGTCLPLREPEKVESHLLKNLSLINRDSSIEHPPQGVLRKESLGLRRVSSIELDKTCFKTLREQITAYFDGSCVNFSMDIPLALDGFSSFWLHQAVDVMVCGQFDSMALICNFDLVIDRILYFQCG